MRNTWIESIEVNKVEDRILNEETILRDYYFNDPEKFNDRIEEISQIVLDEFWQEEAFNHDPDYCQHMMYWKSFLQEWLTLFVVEETNNYKKEESLFSFIMNTFLDKIDFFNKSFTDMFYNNESSLRCQCGICN